MLAYATRAQLAAYVGASVALPTTAEQDRMLLRATEFLATRVAMPFNIDAQGLPSDAVIKDEWANAVCAQVEWWLLTGDEAEASAKFDGGPIEMRASKVRVAPRAADALRRAGLGGGAISA